MERTFIMITPDGTARGKVGAIVERLEDKGFKLVSLKLLTPSLELARAHFSGAAVKPYFEGLVENMCAGPVVAMCWEGTGVIAQGYAMLGALDPADALPGTVRGDGCVQSGRQLCHGSANATAANQELNLWFTQEELCLYEGASNSWVYESCEKKDGKEAASLVAADVRATGPNKADIKKNEPAQTSAALDDLMSLPATELFALLGSPLVDKARTVEAMTALKARLRDPAFVSPSMDVEDILARTRRGGADEWTLLDARSPSEYATGRIPGAQSLPLFDDAERARVGTDFKHDGPQEAMFVGMCIVAPKLPALVERARMLAGPGGRVAVHCWRGGMRSRSLAWLLRLHGLEVVVLEGGYKAFRAWVRVSWGGLTMAPASAPAGPKKQEKRSYSKVRTILPGLTLFPGVLEPTTHDSVVQELQTLLERGRKGDLGGHTYTPVPMKFEARKQSREMLQFGAYTHSNRVESAMVEPLPPPLILVIDKLIVAGVFRPHERPDCCTVNFYKPGNWLPPHIDSKKFARPFASVSLLSAQVVEVGQVCEKQEDFKCVQRVEMPVSSCIRFHGKTLLSAYDCQKLPKTLEFKLLILCG
jgi:nucleoside-diphosphate kinase